MYVYTYSKIEQHFLLDNFIIEKLKMMSKISISVHFLLK